MINIEKMMKERKDRPSSDDILGIEEKTICKAGRNVFIRNTPKEMNYVFNVHKKMMPIIEEMITGVLKKEEKHSAHYFPLARDAEVMHDALYGLSKSEKFNDLLDRITLLKTSVTMKYNNDEKKVKKYFESAGITKERIFGEKRIVFLDSGFEGSLFGFALNSIMGHNFFIEDDNEFTEKYKNIKGYLACRTDYAYSFTEQMLYDNNSLKKLIGSMKENPYGEHIEDPCGRDSYPICACMQLMPKFTERFVKPYKTEKGKWDVKPKDSTKRQVLNSCIEGNYSCVNADITNPVISMILQKRTLDYFTEPKVWKRVSDKVHD